MNYLTSYEQFQTLLTSQSDRVLFKHSGTCSISGGACKNVETAITKLALDNVYQLDVINTGELKYKIADFLAIRHESPQVIIFSKGKVQSYANHNNITETRITQQIEVYK